MPINSVWKNRIWKTGTFRLAVIFSLIFGIGSGVFLVILNLTIVRLAESEIQDALRHQLAIMRADVKLEGAAALSNVLKEHSRTDSLGRYSYRVVTPAGVVFSNGLGVEAEDIDGAGRLKNRATTLLIMTERMPDGTFLAVGRDTMALAQLRTGLNRVALWGGIGLVVLSIGAGAVSGYLFLKRLDGVNDTIVRIMDSRLDMRIPAIGYGREFDELAGNLNLMLKRLEVAVTSLRQVSADLAHDLRTPLTRLRLRLETAEHSKPEVQQEEIRIAIEEIDEILRLFGALLRITRVESGEARLSGETVNLADVAREVIDAYLPSVEDDGHRLELIATGACEVSGDKRLLRQVMSNLIENALTHTPDGTQIIVSVAGGADGVELTVADDGPGIADDFKPHVMKRFYRLDASRSRVGYGLGLPLVAAVSEAHRATVSLHDNAPGLRVSIHFPLGMT
ncbi:sensor histidine kinase [Asticcacaulis endophyticus]|uniref:histidine kinase n=1 Tax=Asticcacaulis endophyticus TaxID=1395890 RepID=A0A918QB83_9CAUL|nr:HAMP domain-containing sensor histidine kinase [Asticcacaulis endophyticus]GGZ39685.1 two-component sensor histidine kinase [Asticcacaulis endophyticus]